MGAINIEYYPGILLTQNNIKLSNWYSIPGTSRGGGMLIALRAVEVKELCRSHLFDALKCTRHFNTSLTFHFQDDIFYIKQKQLLFNNYAVQLTRISGLQQCSGSGSHSYYLLFTLYTHSGKWSRVHIYTIYCSLYIHTLVSGLGFTFILFVSKQGYKYDQLDYKSKVSECRSNVVKDMFILLA